MSEQNNTRLSGRRYDPIRPEPSISLVSIHCSLKPAFSLDRVSLVPTADSWAVRSGPLVSVALADSAGLWVSAPEERTCADRYVVGCDFLDLTFYFSFAGLSVGGNW